MKAFESPAYEFLLLDLRLGQRHLWRRWAWSMLKSRIVAVDLSCWKETTLIDGFRFLPLESPLLLEAIIPFRLERG
jgi:hypothetical protein